MVYRVVRAVVIALARVAIALLAGLRVEGRENVPRRGAVILAPNHISASDPVIAGVAIPRPVYFMAKENLFGIRFLGALMRAVHAYPIDPEKVDRAALRKTEDILRAGEGVVIYPEGKISKDGRLQPLLPGVILMAQRTGAPVLPVGIVGAEAVIPYGEVWPRKARGPVLVRFGTPIPAEELTGGLRGRAALEHGARRLAAAIADLTGEQLLPEAGALPEADAYRLKKEGFAEYSNEQ